MKRIFVTVLMGLAMVFSAGAGEEAAGKRVGLVNVGGFDEPLFGRVASHLSTHLKSTPKVLAPRDAAGKDDLQAEAKALAGLVTGDVVCVVGVAAMPESVKAHGAVDRESKTAVINATALKPAEYTEEGYGRRLEKEAIRCAGFLVGMKDCPNPQCAMFKYENSRELDQKGRAYCPPCQMIFAGKAAEQKLNLRKDGGTP